PDSRASLTGITCPTLVLCGNHDQLTLPELHRSMANLIPSADLVVLEHSGHLTPLEEPENVTDHLKRLLQRDPVRK
ncbi:MAG: alpha/beta hydrolase, partial [Pseudomonadota bacterium]|nr:alpha/beta hydrolase [Pseudomonadota bacterium]